MLDLTGFTKAIVSIEARRTGVETHLRRGVEKEGGDTADATILANLCALCTAGMAFKTDLV